MTFNQNQYFPQSKYFSVETRRIHILKPYRNRLKCLVKNPILTWSACCGIVALSKSILLEWLTQVTDLRHLDFFQRRAAAIDKLPTIFGNYNVPNETATGACAVRWFLRGFLQDFHALE
jgi:hypothetical protein